MNTEAFKRKLTAILSADVEGYSRLMGEDEDATIRTLTAYRELMFTLIQKHRGRVVDSPGDNLLAEFLSVVDAVRCAVEIQEELRVRNDELPENRRMVFRIGINLGDVVQEEERIYGDGINIAARVEGLAEGGGICISGTVYDSIKNKLSLSYESMGEHTVKNIKEPVRVYRMRIGPEAETPVVREEKTGPRPWQRAALGAVAVLVLVAGAWAAWNFYLRPAPPPAEVSSERTPAPESAQKPAPPPVPAEPSIAVLPFANISGDPKEDYLSDGITEQIITALSKTPQMLVIARNSVFTYKGKPVMVQQVSEELGVRYVLEGSVQKEGDRVRITAQLIDAKTGNHLWSERYDRDLKDLFELQDDITKNVITALQVKLTVGQDASALGKGTKNLEAYLKVMKGLRHYYRLSKSDNEIARQFFEEAIELDPNYANAYVRLGWSYRKEAVFRCTKTPGKSYEKALGLAKKAITLDEQNANAHLLLANVYAKTGQFGKAMAAGKKGLSIDPANASVNATYGLILYNLGQFKEAIPFFEKAKRIDPKPPSWFLAILGASYSKMDKFKEAIPFLKEAIRLDPKPPSWYLEVLGASYYKMGASYYEMSKFKETITVLKEAIRISPQPPTCWELYLLGTSYYKMDQFKEAITALKEAISLWPDFLAAHVGLAAAYSLAGRMEEARAQAAEVLRINPEFSLQDVAKNGYYTFQKAYKERFINALRTAGLK